LYLASPFLDQNGHGPRHVLFHRADGEIHLLSDLRVTESVQPVHEEDFSRSATDGIESPSYLLQTLIARQNLLGNGSRVD
jgi:hypothetical protein